MRRNVLDSLSFLTLFPLLEELDLYDNRIHTLDKEALAVPKRLVSLDLSFNLIQDILPLSRVTPSLERLYLVSNDIHEIRKGTFDHFKNLQLLELGANKLKVFGLPNNYASINLLIFRDLKIWKIFNHWKNFGLEKIYSQNLM